MSEQTFTEAPASVNLKFNYRGADIMLTLRDASGLDLLNKLDAAMDKLEQKGASFTARNGNNGHVDPGAPICPTHGTPMKPSKHGGYFCPKKVAETGGGADGSKPIYCKAKSN